MILIAGPCVIESEQHALDMAGAIQEMVPDGWEWYYKSSFDKANRSRGDSPRGPGFVHGMDVLAAVKRAGHRVCTDFHEPWQLTTEFRADVVDLVQIPAFLCRQTDLLLAAAKTGKKVAIKKGQFMAPWDMRNVIAKCPGYIVERGTAFGYNDLVVDYRGVSEMRTFAPVIFDATHSSQTPGKGGNRRWAEPLARAAAAVGVDGFFFEVHQDPDNAPSDGPNMVRLDRFKEILESLNVAPRG